MPPVAKGNNKMMMNYTHLGNGFNNQKRHLANYNSHRQNQDQISSFADQELSMHSFVSSKCSLRSNPRKISLFNNKMPHRKSVESNSIDSQSLVSSSHRQMGRSGSKQNQLLSLTSSVDKYSPRGTLASAVNNNNDSSDYSMFMQKNQL